MDKSQYKIEKRAGRHARIRAKISGTAERPRLAVFKSNKFVYAQLINDEAGKTLAAMDSRKVKGTTSEGAVVVGTEIAKKAKSAGITAVVFDRGGFKYQGIIAALADAARAEGLTF
jgi:large subunit ribosomal protein L18